MGEAKNKKIYMEKQKEKRRITRKKILFGIGGFFLGLTFPIWVPFAMAYSSFVDERFF